MDSPDGDEKSANFRFTIDKQSGNDVLAIDKLAIGYSGKPVSENLDLRVYKGDRIALIGPNGVGKSTLLKTIFKILKPLGGEIRYGTNVQFGYYDQEQATLMGTSTVLEELWSDWPTMNEKDVRGILGRFLFTGDDAGKSVTSLSGGEKARLSLAKLMLQKSNTLILDEPTNHLDLDSKEVLENGLDDFPGTIMFVSHDRYFINRIATKVIDISANGAVEYLGDYDYFIDKKQEQAELLADKNAALANKTQTLEIVIDDDKELKKQKRRLTRAITEIELEIANLDESISQLQTELEHPDFADDHVKLMEIQAQIDSQQGKHDTLAENWLVLLEELESL